MRRTENDMMLNEMKSKDRMKEETKYKVRWSIII